MEIFWFCGKMKIEKYNRMWNMLAIRTYIAFNRWNLEILTFNEHSNGLEYGFYGISTMSITLMQKNRFYLCSAIEFVKYIRLT